MRVCGVLTFVDYMINVHGISGESCLTRSNSEKINRVYESIVSYNTIYGYNDKIVPKPEFMDNGGITFIFDKTSISNINDFTSQLNGSISSDNNYIYFLI